MKSQFAFVINEDLERVFHEFPADILDLSWKGGWEHHHLLLMRRLLKDFLNISSHVYIFMGEASDIPVSSSILSHSSRTNIWRLDRSRSFLLVSARILPGVPTMMCGCLTPFNKLMCSYMGCPPYITSVLISGRYFVNLLNSFLI